MSRINTLMVALLASVLFAAVAHGATNTNPRVRSKAPEPVKIGHLVFEGGDGISLEQAVIIKNAKGEEEGVDAEAKWIKKIHPGWRKGNQALMNRDGKSYDRIEYTTPERETKTIFFDITDFFGK